MAPGSEKAERCSRKLSTLPTIATFSARAAELWPRLDSTLAMFAMSAAVAVSDGRHGAAVQGGVGSHRIAFEANDIALSALAAMFNAEPKLAMPEPT